MAKNPQIIAYVKMKNIAATLCLGLLFLNLGAKAAPVFPIKGLCLAAPAVDQVDRFDTFIREVLAPQGINVLILRVDYRYNYRSHPELIGENPLSQAQIKKLVRTCQDKGIRLIPQINLLGHQSWHSTASKLLEVYPQFDETPHVALPETYEWPNADGLYCKSYCPLHPEVHGVVFALVDEICEVFESDAFHAGMDEVFYLGDEKCPRCQGRDKAELFAGEVRKINDHLAQNQRELWIWGDRLIDGKTTGIGLWEASYNNTHRAIDMIPKEVMICDWHYERPDQTPVWFAMKGFRVLTCPWRNPAVAIVQTEDMARLRRQATPQMQDRYAGMLQTVWSSAERFMDEYEGKVENEREDGFSQAACFQQMLAKIAELERY